MLPILEFICRHTNFVEISAIFGPIFESIEEKIGREIQPIRNFVHVCHDILDFTSILPDRISDLFGHILWVGIWESKWPSHTKEGKNIISSQYKCYDY